MVEAENHLQRVANGGVPQVVEKIVQLVRKWWSIYLCKNVLCILYHGWFSRIMNHQLPFVQSVLGLTPYWFLSPIIYWAYQLPVFQSYELMVAFPLWSTVPWAAAYAQPAPGAARPHRSAAHPVISGDSQGPRPWTDKLNGSEFKWKSNIFSWLMISLQI